MHTLKELTLLCVNHNTGWKIINVIRELKSCRKVRVGEITSTGKVEGQLLVLDGF